MQRIKRMGGGWFDASASDLITDIYWYYGGHSKTKQAPKTREYLYITHTGRFILNCWAARGKESEVFYEISREHATHWLFLNRIDPKDVPHKTLRKGLRRLYDKLQTR